MDSWELEKQFPFVLVVNGHVKVLVVKVDDRREDALAGDRYSRRRKKPGDLRAYSLGLRFMIFFKFSKCSQIFALQVHTPVFYMYRAIQLIGSHIVEKS